jgi:hypothetical protein
MPAKAYQMRFQRRTSAQHEDADVKDDDQDYEDSHVPSPPLGESTAVAIAANKPMILGPGNCLVSCF